MRAIAASIVVFSGAIIIGASAIASALRQRSLSELDPGLTAGVVTIAVGAWLLWSDFRDKKSENQTDTHKAARLP